jgi:hypothetical protein
VTYAVTNLRAITSRPHASRAPLTDRRQHDRVATRPFPALTFVERSRLPHDENAAEAAWLDLTRLLFDGDVTDESTLDLLVRNAYYRDDYLVPGSPLTPKGTRHGPYRLDCLDTDSFEFTDRATAEEVLHRWDEESSPSSVHHDPRLMHTAEQILAAATTIFYLGDLRETCEHESGGCLGDFHEFVVLNRHDGILTVLVASTTRESEAPSDSAS